MSSEDKVIQSIEHMTKNIAAATEVTTNGDEVYFKFAGHLFSLIKWLDRPEVGDFGFFVYGQWPGTIPQLIQEFEYGPADHIVFTVFYSGKMEHPQAKLAMQQLYSALRSNVVGVDSILDDVLRTKTSGT